MPISQNCGKQWPYFTKSREGNWWGRGCWVFTLEWRVINRFHGHFFCLQYVRLCLEIYLRWLEYSWPIPNSCPPEPQTATIQEFLQMDSKAIVQRWDDLGLEKTWNKRTVVTDTEGKKKMCKDRQKSERWNFKLERKRRKWDQEGTESRFFSEPPERTRAYFHLDLGLPASRIVTKQVWVVSRHLAHDSNFVHLPYVTTATLFTI